ncbi:hypothetical protein [Comamonas terrigena]|uniref:Uncharacterized protein n=1 Tax=Comamonas terrigena TaxID=32013 RepID=A0A2A7UPH0_COMTR|nr:hypothetical protein [Comamonas terrigena]PEH87215.1 hypothetical protein CRM82_00015 [Comamonas terrigena]
MNAQGRGRQVELSLYDWACGINGYYALDAMPAGHDTQGRTMAHPSIVPYGHVQAAGGPLIYCGGNNSQCDNSGSPV